MILPQKVCGKIAKEILQKHHSVLDENIALKFIDELINTRETLEKFYELRLEKDDKYFVDQSSRIEIMYFILGESLGTSNQASIKSSLVGYSNANAEVVERISKCLKDARSTYRNLQ